MIPRFVCGGVSALVGNARCAGLACYGTDPKNKVCTLFICNWMRKGYKKQEVTLGASNGKKVQILTGLKAGDRVVTKGAYQVKLASASNAIPAHSHEH